MIRLGQSYAPGLAEGRAVVLSQPLSFYGGIDVATGRIIDHAHPDLGRSTAGCILVMPGGRGSSSSSSVLAEAIRRTTAPVGIVLARPDPIMTIACLVAQTLYGVACPIIVCQIDGICNDDLMQITCTESGEATLECVAGI